MKYILPILLLCAALSCSIVISPKQMTPIQKMYLQISNIYEARGMKDSAAYYKKVSKKLTP